MGKNRLISFKFEKKICDQLFVSISNYLSLKTLDTKTLFENINNFTIPKNFKSNLKLKRLFNSFNLNKNQCTLLTKK